MISKEHIGYISSISKNRGVVYSKTYDEEYYFTIEKQNRNLKVNDRVVFLLKEQSYYTLDDKAFDLRKVYTNTKGINFYSRVNQAHIHLDLDSLLPELIDKIHNTEKEIIEIEYVFPENVGLSSCVEVSESDLTIYAVRKGRDKHSKFVMGKAKTPSNSVFAVFKRTEYGYLILTIFVGSKAGREPWDKYATSEDKRFWDNHALVFDNNEIINSSIVTKCPW